MRILLISLVLCIAGCSLDTVDSRYENIAAARADNLFNRGWLPDLLPESSTNIRTSNDLDVNISTGGFDFTPKDSDKFFQLLTRGAPKDSKFSDWQDTVKTYASNDFAAWTYKNEGFTWVFFCHNTKGHCEYFMW